jgi:signal transduction histidine kinase
MIFSDENRFRQILLNLLSNALKFTFKGSINIELASFFNDYIKVSVSDTGIGIQEEDFHALFKTFGMIQTSSSINRTGKFYG